MSNETQGAGGSPWEDDPRLVAYALGETSELSAADVAEIEAALGSDPGCARVLGEIRQLLPGIEGALRASAASAEFELGEPARDAILDAARAGSAGGRRPGSSRSRWTPLLAAGLAVTAGAGAWVLTRSGTATGPALESEMVATAADDQVAGKKAGGLEPELLAKGADAAPDAAPPAARKRSASRGSMKGKARGGSGDVRLGDTPKGTFGAPAPSEAPSPSVQMREWSPVDAPDRARESTRFLDEPRRMELGAPVDDERFLLAEKNRSPVTEPEEESADLDDGEEGAFEGAAQQMAPEAPFTLASVDPFSTFSIDVDTASYGMARAQLGRGRMPDPRSVRVEEFVNYFTYGDRAPGPGDEHPLAVGVEVAAAPWAPEHLLVRVGLKAREVAFDDRRGANLVFLVDVSGSMRSPDKLGLVKDALGMLTEALLPGDRVAIVTYAGEPGVALESTPVAARESILQSLEALEAGGSTNGGAGIERAYAIARDHLVEGGVNRVVLCTDGDFNVGAVADDALEELIAGEARDGIELSVLGFGADSSGGDGRMEQLSNRGNGNYAMIDSRAEARRVLSSEVGGTLLTVARDTKIQLAWNAARVEAFRLIGYENRRLEHRDFEDDAVDAGEVGSGHAVTALYEVIPVPGAAAGARIEEAEAVLVDRPAEALADEDRSVGRPDALRGRVAPEPFTGDGLVEVRVRYKAPLDRTRSEESAGAAIGLGGGDDSRLIAVVGDGAGQGFAEASEDLRFAAAVAAFALELRGAASVAEVSLGDIRRWALEALGSDPGGLREGFVKLVEQAMEIRGK